jgi:hypothetical protein
VLSCGSTLLGLCLAPIASAQVFSRPSIFSDRQHPVQFANRIVLLGASNLTLSLRLVVELMQRRLGGPSQVLVAAGLGRSYGRFSQLIVRGVPGIHSCGLWSQLESAPSLPTYALLTDIGNDVANGVAPHEIVSWVSACVNRLRQHNASMVMTNLPTAGLSALAKWRFLAVRSVYFPFSRIPMNVVIENAKAVHRGLTDLSANKHVELVEQPAEWFGPDVVHIHPTKRRLAYGSMIERLPLGSTDNVDNIRSDSILAWGQRPRFAYRTMIGVEQREPQPSGRFTNGSVVSLF